MIYLLPKNKFTIIDEEDFKIIKGYKWFAHKNKTRIYVDASKNGKMIRMHRLIMNAKPYEQVDHINGNCLDNRKVNLRLCSNKENTRNRTRLNKNNTSGFKGVSWYKWYNKWLAQIKVDYKTKTLGYFESKEDAAKAYNKAAKKYFNKFANINKIQIQNDEDLSCP